MTEAQNTQNMEQPNGSRLPPVSGYLPSLSKPEASSGDVAQRRHGCDNNTRTLRGGSSNGELPLFQGEDGGSNPTPPLQFRIREIKQETAERWIEKWHYSHRMPTGKNVCFGLYAGSLLYAVIVYGIGVNPYQASFLGVERVLEIKRMCRSEPKLNYELSRFIALTLRRVGKENPWDCIVAFADPEQGHEGTVYKAAGFVLHGMTNPEWHLEDDEGQKRHRRFAFRHARRNGQSIAASREQLGMKRVQTKPKYRWVKYRITPAGASAAPTVTPQERATSTPGTTEQADNAAHERPPEL